MLSYSLTTTINGIHLNKTAPFHIEFGMFPKGGTIAPVVVITRAKK